MSDVNTKKRTPVKRWIVLGLVLLGAYAAFWGPSILKPIAPVVVLPAEPTGLVIGGFKITNTILATLIADLVLIMIAFLSVQRFMRSGKVAPSGFYNAFEAIVEFLWNTVDDALGKHAKRVFPVVATIFLLIFVANMVKLLPGFESIGYMKEAHHDPAYAPVKLFSIGNVAFYTIDKGQPVPVESHSKEEDGAHAEEGEAGSAYAGEKEEKQEGPTTELCHACEVVPFLRGSATDLNFTVALAVIAVVYVQVIGVMALGPGYFSKFFQFQRLIKGGIFGMIDFIVGFLELILEFAKILSFAFRLFGNIFAGALLLSIIGALLPIVLPPGLYLFEIFFGVIQAYVFFLLATVFMNMATVGHGGGHQEEGHH